MESLLRMDSPFLYTMAEKPFSKSALRKGKKFKGRLSGVEVSSSYESLQCEISNVG